MSPSISSASARSSARCSGESDPMSLDMAAMRRAMSWSSSSSDRGFPGKKSPYRCMRPSKSKGSPRSRASIIEFSSASMSRNRCMSSADIPRIPWVRLRKYDPSTCSFSHSSSWSNFLWASGSTNR